jgi:diacylglycerol kinase (ATP)
MSTWVLGNPHAGSAETGRALAERPEARGWRWLWTESPEEASCLARDAAARGVERIVVAGGDGSVHGVVQELMEAETRPTLGVLPLGTGNDLARSLGMPLDPEEAFEILAEEAAVREIDVARCELDEERRWLVNVSAGGFAGAVDRALDEETKKRWGPLAYLRAALEVLADLPVHELAVRIDGKRVERLRVVGVMVANGRTAGGGVRVAPDADLEDGRLDVTLVEAGSAFELAPVGAALQAGTALSQPKVHHHVGARVELTAEPPIPTNVDGELLGDVAHASFEVVPGALRVVVGPDYGRLTTR